MDTKVRSMVSITLAILVGGLVSWAGSDGSAEAATPVLVPRPPSN